MVDRYLFRDDRLIGQGHTNEYFTSISKQGDYMLVRYSHAPEESWGCYLVIEESGKKRFDWVFNERTEAQSKRLRALLLLQQ